jgi:type II secretory pathway pseudopilin PulG
MYRSNDNILIPGHGKAFMLIELVAALTILTIVISSVLAVMSQCIDATIDSRNRAIAFRIARDNMENLLTLPAVRESADFGAYELNPDIEWETIVETVNHPKSSAMWLQAICSATYTDSKGERQSIEFTHWLTDLTIAQQRKIKDQKKREEEFMDEYDENPFGDDPEGLMKYANALAAGNDFERAIEAAYDLIDEYPDSELVPWAERKIGEWEGEAAGSWTDEPGNSKTPYDEKPSNIREPSGSGKPTTRPDKEPTTESEDPQDEPREEPRNIFDDYTIGDLLNMSEQERNKVFEQYD